MKRPLVLNGLPREAYAYAPSEAALLARADAAAVTLCLNHKHSSELCSGVKALVRDRRCSSPLIPRSSEAVKKFNMASLLSSFCDITPEVNQHSVPLLWKRHRDLLAASRCRHSSRLFLLSCSPWLLALLLVLPSVDLHPRLRQSRSPTETYPLLDIVSETRP
jgi:hypothetical protein